MQTITKEIRSNVALDLNPDVLEQIIDAHHLHSRMESLHMDMNPVTQGLKIKAKKGKVKHK